MYRTPPEYPDLCQAARAPRRSHDSDHAVSLDTGVLPPSASTLWSNALLSQAGFKLVPDIAAAESGLLGPFNRRL